MSQPRDLVKFRCLKVTLLCILVGLSSAAQALQIQAKKFLTETYETHPNYLVMALRYEPAAEVRKELEAEFKITLKERGEAHITVITPPEFEILKKYVSIEEINALAKKRKMQAADVKFLCVGKGVVPENPQKSGKLETYFLVAKSKRLLKIRKEIESLWKSKGGQGDFSAEHFYPHVTLGFSERDLHESDGVIKDERSCIDSHLPAR